MDGSPAGSERNKNLPVPSMKAEQARRRSRKEFSRPRWGYRKKEKMPRPPLSSLGSLWFRGSRDVGKQAVRIDGIKGIPVKSMTLS